MKSSILVINGPNLNLLGKREPEKYGSLTLNDLQNQLTNKYSDVTNLEFFQSNHEGEIVDKIQTSRALGMVINLGAYTHTSIAIADSLSFALKNNGVVAAVEVHISNVYARESFRQKSYISGIVNGVIAGLGTEGYFYAVEFCINSITK
jgi:3-dehydroquinate dehydratase-2